MYLHITRYCWTEDPAPVETRKCLDAVKVPRYIDCKMLDRWCSRSSRRLGMPWNVVNHLALALLGRLIVLAHRK